MIRYTCDRCKCDITPHEELRYTLQVEVKAVFETPAVEHEESDHLLELHEILERLDDEESDLISDDVYQRRRYDLCCDCYKQYQRNPLGREPSVSFGFSPN